MVVVRSLTRTLIFWIALLYLAGFSSETKCNRRLLEMFRLSGTEYAVADKMEVCGHVIDKCCSVSDEIRRAFTPGAISCQSVAAAKAGAAVSVTAMSAINRSMDARYNGKRQQ